MNCLNGFIPNIQKIIQDLKNIHILSKSRSQKIKLSTTLFLGEGGGGRPLIFYQKRRLHYFSKKNVWRRPLNRLPVRKRTERALSLYGTRAKIRRNGLHRICGRLHNTVYGISICRRAKPTGRRDFLLPAVMRGRITFIRTLLINDKI